MEYHIKFVTDTYELHLLDQRFLPEREETFVCRTVADVVKALQVMVVRGAPAIGVTAAWGCIIALREAAWSDDAQGHAEAWQAKLKALLSILAEARPTAVNLAWAVARMEALWQASASATTLLDIWTAEAARVQQEDIAINKAMGHFGAACIEDNATVMTHCNAGALATAGYGTALGVIRAAVEAGKKIQVIANETRPFLQGSRLTAYELAKDAIPVTVACDNACGLLMQRGMVDCVVVGADRVAANGDAANKIGTYSVALLAKEHNIPFYVAVPLSTIDRDTADGTCIPIEERPDREVTHVGETCIVPHAVPVYNFAFDVTPARLITGIITEKGVLRPPYVESIAQAFTR